VERDDELMSCLRQGIQSCGQQPNPLDSLEELALAEKELGFPLPDVLRFAYSHVGNGAFGPGFGILPIRGGAASPPSDNATASYMASRAYFESVEPYMKWPEKLLPLCRWDDGTCSCVACGEADTPVYRYRPPADWSWDVFDVHLSKEASSLRQWLMAWAKGDDLR
jgi:hypothetical protein